MANTPSQTQQAIQAMNGEIGSLKQQVATLREENSLLRAFNDQLADFNAKLAVLEHKVEDLRKGKDTSSNRIWMVALAIASAVIGGIITLMFKKLFP